LVLAFAESLTARPLAALPALQGAAVKFPRRRFLCLAAGVAAVPVVSRIARAQAYPTRPVRLIVPSPVADLYGRLYGGWLAQRLGQPFVIESRVGVGGNIATEAVVRAPPDGHTLLWVTSANAWNASLYGSLNFDFIRDIAPVASSHRGEGVLVVHPSFPANTVRELIAYATANPGKVDMASGGVGSGQHIWGELFKMLADVDMLHVPYRGAGPALAALLAGQTPVMFDTLATSIGHIKAGSLRALAVIGATRSRVLPNVPTVGEFVPGYEANGWGGVGAPKDTPAAIIDTLNREISAAIADPAISSRITDLGSVPMPMTASDFGKFIAAETEKWAKVIRFANIKPL
jgi:tripartite-type tricarboxylate transporter receptor subunit TctC